MKAQETIIILCSECKKAIKMSADDAIIRWMFNGGCPGYSVKVPCKHCGKLSVVKPTDEAKYLLRYRINAI